MTQKETQRFLEIFLQNHPEYTGVLLLMHDKEHNTHCGCINTAECSTMNQIAEVMHTLISKME